MINAYDIETKIRNNRFYPFCVSFSFNDIIYSAYGDNCMDESFLFLLEMVEKFYKCEQENKLVILYVHNINFDGFLIIEYLSKKKYLMSLMCIKMNIYYIRVKIGKIYIE
jgi:hypothetical protein